MLSLVWHSGSVWLFIHPDFILFCGTSPIKLISAHASANQKCWKQILTRHISHFSPWFGIILCYDYCEKDKKGSKLRICIMTADASRWFTDWILIFKYSISRFGCFMAPVQMKFEFFGYTIFFPYDNLDCVWLQYIREFVVIYQRVFRLYCGICAKRRTLECHVIWSSIISFNSSNYIRFNTERM